MLIKTSPDLNGVTKLFLRVVNTTFGGGYITMVILGRELVEVRHWLTRDEYELAFSLGRVTPGTNLIAFCAAVGAILRGWSGATLAVLAATLPSSAFAVLLVVSFETWQNRPLMMGAIATTVAAVTGMMWASVFSLIRPHWGGVRQSIKAVIISGAAFLASWRFGVTPVPIILGACVAGFLWVGGDSKA